MLASRLNLPRIYLDKQQKLQESHKGRVSGNHQGHLHRKREEDVMKMKEEKGQPSGLKEASVLQVQITRSTV